MPRPSKPMHIQNVEDVPGEYYFRYDEFGADTEVPPHSHSWGHLNYTPHGSMCMDTAGQHWVSPPQYGVWARVRFLSEYVHMEMDLLK